MTRIERAVLLCNAQLTKAESSMYNGSRSDINNHEVSVEFNCFPVRGEMVDKAAKMLLEDITGVRYSTASSGTGASMLQLGLGQTIVDPGQVTGKDTLSNKDTKAVFLDSTNYTYGIMEEGNSSRIDELVDAAKGTK
jgi:hypothetical protein